MKKFYRLICRSEATDSEDSENHGNVFDEAVMSFNTIEEVKDYLRNNYKGITPEAMYIDRTAGKKSMPYRIGWIFCFWNQDISHNSEKWWQKDWIELREETTSNVELSEKGWELYTKKKTKRV
jgi:hypothetical protein